MTIQLIDCDQLLNCDPTLVVSRVLRADTLGRGVLYAALEHSIPDLGIKVTAGGLGKVMDQVVRFHPGRIGFVTAAVGDVDYTGDAWTQGHRCVTRGRCHKAKKG